LAPPAHTKRAVDPTQSITEIPDPPWGPMFLLDCIGISTTLTLLAWFNVVNVYWYNVLQYSGTALGRTATVVVVVVVVI
jgi:hypothetical protein